MIGYSPDKKTIVKCVFKRFDIATEFVYTADDIKAFGYKDGKRFESIETEGKKSFYEVLVYGDLTLYRKQSRYLLKNINQSFINLNDNTITWNDSKTEIKFDGPEELISYLKGDTIGYRKGRQGFKKEILPAVIAYNSRNGKKYSVPNRHYSESNIVNQAWRSGSNINRFGIITGLNIYSLKLKTEKNVFIPVPDPEKGPAFGLSYSRVLSRSSDKSTLRVDLLYLKQDFYTYNEEYTYNDLFVKDDAFFHFVAMKIPVLYQYSFKGKRVEPFVNGGLSYAFFIKRNYIHINESEAYDKNIFIKEDHNIIFRTGEFSAFIGTGIRVRLINNIDLQIEARLEEGAGFFNGNRSNLALTQSSFQPGIFAGLVF
ncbi:MAG TPA: hypothetical protein VHO46_04385 [Bacteroidales bacterium]|nr:hypothetical protein [Bacteroidales bacterium]